MARSNHTGGELILSFPEAGGGRGRIYQGCKALGFGHCSHCHRSSMAANYDLQYWEAVLGQSGYLAYVMRDNHLAFKIFGHLLKPRSNVHCITQYR